MLISIPISAFVARRTREIQRKVMAVKDERIKVQDGRERGEGRGRKGRREGIRSDGEAFALSCRFLHFLATFLSGHE
jgi:hypothetical protein